MKTNKPADITIADFHPRQDGFIQTYKGEWREQGMCATAWLDSVAREHFPRGIFLKHAYELSSTYERIQGGKARGARQEELGAKLAHNLRERMETKMRAAGWQVVGKTREGQDIWQYKPVPDVLKHAVTTRQVLVTRTARPVSFTCEVCGRHTTEYRLPGPKPRYCSDPCKKAGQRTKARMRVARFKARRKKSGNLHSD
jgi:hypothetical protein